MKKVISVILFVLSIIAALLDVFVCVYGFIDINNDLTDLSMAHASGADYLGVAVGVGVYAIVIFFISLFGSIISGINAKIAVNKAVRYISLGMVSMFILLLMTPIVMSAM
ncbi:MAG: hypothetical protein ACI396_05970 [Acutalibacteraceae bacterium]